MPRPRRALGPRAPLAPLVELVGQGVAQAFVTPQPLPMVIHEVEPGSASPRPHGYPVVHGDYVATLHRDGRLTGAAVLGSSLDPVFDRAVLAAVARVDSIGFRFPPPETMRGDSAFVRLRVGPAGAPGATPMFRARVPRRAFDAAPIEAAPPAVRYSAEALAAGVGGTVTAWFVVDTAGVPVARSVQVVRADHPLLLRMVLDALPTLRYAPARVGGCAVPARVTRRFDLAPPAGAVAASHGAPAVPRPKTPVRREDGERPRLDLDGVGLSPTNSRRGQPVIAVSVVIDEGGRPDLETLRVTGPAAAANRAEIERWIAAGRYAPARDARGNAVRGEFRYDVSAAMRVVRMP